jgi:hypothetical protein
VKGVVVKNYFLCVAAIFIAGCNSGDQIEKCVQAGIASYGTADKTSESKAETEFMARKICLEAASGKKN